MAIIDPIGKARSFRAGIEEVSGAMDEKEGLYFLEAFGWWTSSGRQYAAGDRVKVGREFEEVPSDPFDLFECVLEHTSSQGTSPKDDAEKWGWVAASEEWPLWTQYDYWGNPENEYPPGSRVKYAGKFWRVAGEAAARGAPGSDPLWEAVEL